MMKLASLCKMIKIYFLLFFCGLITSQVEAKNSCNDECLTKTYCMSSYGADVCSNNNLVTAQFKAIPVFGEYDHLQLTLKGFNVVADDEKTIKVNFDRPNFPSNAYTCYKSSLGSTGARFYRGTYNLTTGSSSYKNGVLSCTWTFNINDDIWPTGVDMVKDSPQTITLHLDSTFVVVALDTNQLPIYHAQYLKCCNKVHGNDAFLLTFDQTKKQIHYQLYYWKQGGKKVTVTLTTKDDVKLQFECNLHSDVRGFLSNGIERIPINHQLQQPAIINNEICSWASPFILGNSKISIDASTSVFDLRVEDDIGTVYTEKGVTLKNSSHLTELSFLLMVFAVLFQITSIC